MTRSPKSPLRFVAFLFAPSLRCAGLHAEFDADAFNWRDARGRGPRACKSEPPSLGKHHFVSGGRPSCDRMSLAHARTAVREAMMVYHLVGDRGRVPA